MENRDENTKKLFIGNLSYQVTDWEQFKNDMGQIGKVLRANIVTDKETKKPRGFAFIIVPASEEAKFLEADGTEYEGRPLVIKPAIERSDKGPKQQGQQNNGRPPRREIRRTDNSKVGVDTDMEATR